MCNLILDTGMFMLIDRLSSSLIDAEALLRVKTSH